MTKAGGLAADHLKSYIERVERMDEEIKTLNDDKRDIYAEAKGNGFDVKAIKIIVRERRMDKDSLDELEAIVETYKRAIGMRSSLDTDSEISHARTRATEFADA